MPTTLPPNVQEVFGEEAAADFAEWLDQKFEERTVQRDEYREVLSRLDVLEAEVAGINERLDRMEGRFEDRFEQIDQRFEQIDQRFQSMEARVDQRLEEQSHQFNQRIDGVHERIDRLHEQMRVQTRWTVGTIALFGTIVTVLLAIAEFGA